MISAILSHKTNAFTTCRSYTATKFYFQGDEETTIILNILFQKIKMQKLNEFSYLLEDINTNIKKCVKSKNSYQKLLDSITKKDFILYPIHTPMRLRIIKKSIQYYDKKIEHLETQRQQIVQYCILNNNTTQKYNLALNQLGFSLNQTSRDSNNRTNEKFLSNTSDAEVLKQAEIMLNKLNATTNKTQEKNKNLTYADFSKKYLCKTEDMSL